MTDDASRILRERAAYAQAQRAEADRKAESEKRQFRGLLQQTLARAESDLSASGADERLRAQIELDARKAETEHVQQWRMNLGALRVAHWWKAWNPKEETEALGVVRDWMAGELGPRHLALIGPKGIGKTIAALHWCKALVEPGKHRGSPVVWLRPDDLVSAVCHQYDPASPRLAKHVVLDEMGEEKREDFLHALRKFLDIDGHKLLITSNLTREQFTQRYSQDVALWDRINSDAQAFYLGGESLRSNDGGF
jgi:DNA replication protein DnaC